MQLSDFKVLNPAPIGTGAFAKTYHMFDMINGRDVAMKVISKRYKSSHDLKNVEDEIRILEYLSNEKKCNPHIVCYYGSFDAKFKSFPSKIIVTEYIEGMTFAKYIKTHPSINVSLAWSIIYELVSGLAYIHSMSVAHRDIKPDNIMVTDKGVIKYIDFGLSCIAECLNPDCTNVCIDNVAGTAYYMPPEYFVKTNKLSDNTIRAQKADIWSLGITLYKLLNGKFPYDDVKTVSELAQTVAYGTIEKSMYQSDLDINYIVDMMLDKDASTRPTALELKIILVDIISKRDLF